MLRPLPTDRENTCKACAACCRPSMMPLTPADLERIAVKGHDIAECTVQSREHPHLRELKSIGNRCYFLEGPGPQGPFWCSLYPDHPAGCKLFPLIYDPIKKKPVLDKQYCPHWKLFQDLLDDPACRAELLRVLRDELHLA